MNAPSTDRQPMLWNVLKEARELSALAEIQREDENAPYLDTVDRLAAHVPALLAEIDRLNADAKLGSEMANNMVRNNNDLHDRVEDLQSQLDKAHAELAEQRYYGEQLQASVESCSGRHEDIPEWQALEDGAAADED